VEPNQGYVRAGQVRSGQVRSGQGRAGQVRSGQGRSGRDRAGQVRLLIMSERERELLICHTAQYDFDHHRHCSLIPSERQRGIKSGERRSRQ
jgi:hypothetical protein